MNNHLRGMITRLEYDLSQADELVAKAESKVRDANKKQYDIRIALADTKQEAATEDKIEELGIRTQTFDLAKRTNNRCKQNKYLQRGNYAIESAWWRIRTFVEHGNLPKYGQGGSPLHRELRVLNWCQTILSYDVANKSVRLAADLTFEVSRINDELTNRIEGTQ
jgi:hypothetical protein